MNADEAMSGTDLPREIRTRAAELSWHSVKLGESRAATFRLEDHSTPVYFLKVGLPIRDQGWLWHEIERLKWLRGRITVPEVVAATEQSGRVFLLITPMPGEDATAVLGKTDCEEIVTLLARGMRQWHGTAVDACPFDHSVPAEIERARYALDNGFVDESDFDNERLGRAAADLFDELVSTVPSMYEPVLTHGDYTLPNVMFRSGQVSGFVDVGRSGVSDRYKDLAICSRSIVRNLGEEFVPVLFREYGIPEPDEDRLRFYKLLDEFG
jgi:aminoglycoside phosphotransferase